MKHDSKRARRSAVFAITLTAGVIATLVPMSNARAQAEAIDKPLTDVPGDAARGRAIVANRQVGLCLLCHTGPIAEERFQGTIAPNLEGAGARWTEGQLRLRIVDSKRLNPQTMMPAYGAATDQLVRVGAGWKGKPVLAPQQIEDVVAYLRTLQ
jgi:L-cysteine S-thiosulfotransferase